jgi:hypothetical protein
MDVHSKRSLVLELYGKAMSRRREWVPHECVVLAAKLPSEVCEEVVHGDQCFHLGKVYPRA